MDQSIFKGISSLASLSTLYIFTPNAQSNRSANSRAYPMNFQKSRYPRSLIHVIITAVLALAGCGGGGDSSNNALAPDLVLGIVSAPYIYTLDTIVFHAQALHGNPTSYRFSVIGQPPNTTHVIKPSKSGDAYGELVPTVAGIYTVNVTTTYANGDEVSDSKTVEVRNAKPQLNLTLVESYPDGLQAVGEELIVSANAMDPDGDPLSFQWKLTGATDYSHEIADPHAETTEITFGSDGTRYLDVIVSDGINSSYAYESYAATNMGKPAVRFETKELVASVGEPVELRMDPLSLPFEIEHYQHEWEFESTPPGSSPSIQKSSRFENPYARFVPDMEGEYKIRVTQSLYGGTDYFLTATVTVRKRIATLEGDVIVDAEYDHLNNRILAVSGNTNVLIILDTETGANSRLALPGTPHAISIEPTSLNAAVALDSSVVIVDLELMEISDQFNTALPMKDLVYAENGYVYCFPSKYVSAHRLSSIEIATGNVTENTGGTVHAGTRAKLRPGKATIYGTSDGESPGTMDIYDTTPGTANIIYESPPVANDNRTSALPDLWFSESGDRVFMSTVDIYQTTDAETDDMIYVGYLPAPIGGSGSIERVKSISMSHSNESDRLVTIDTPKIAMPNYAVLREYDGTTYEFLGEMPNPQMSIDNVFEMLAMKFVFHSADGNEVYVVATTPDSASIAGSAVFRY